MEVWRSIFHGLVQTCNSSSTGTDEEGGKIKNPL